MEHPDLTDDGQNWDHVTFNEHSEPPSKMLELDVHVKPREKEVSHLLSLFADASLDDTSDAINGLSGNGHQGFLEKNLSDFFDIQIFSTVYFGSKREPH